MVRPERRVVLAGESPVGKYGAPGNQRAATVAEPFMSRRRQHTATLKEPKRKPFTGDQLYGMGSHKLTGRRKGYGIGAAASMKTAP